MNNFIKFPKIDQFRQAIRDVNETCRYNDVAIPTLKFKGVVKLHGMNCGIGYNIETDEVWYQSRNQILTGSAGQGFTNWADSNIEKIKLGLKNQSETVENIKTVVVYGEWCGGNIQKGVAINGLEKMFCVFSIVATKKNEETIYFSPISFGGLDIPNLHVIESIKDTIFSIEIDFNRPDLAQNEMVKLVEAVEAQCPVGKFFGNSGVGEGIVWTAFWKHKEGPLRFKTKGQKHSVSKVKNIVEIDTEKQNSIEEFIEYAVTENRLTQAVKETFTTNAPDIKGTGDFIRWVIKDIAEEEGDVLAKSNLTAKEVNKNIAFKTRTWLLGYLNKEVGLCND